MTDATLSQHLLPVEGGMLPLTIARADGVGAAVVVLPSGFGVCADLEQQMRELAQDASLVVALDPFFRTDPGPADYEDMTRVMKRVREIDRERLYRDLIATLTWVRGPESQRAIVVLGVCFGGAFALLAAADGLVDGVVTWHGGRMHEHAALADRMRCPMHFHFGAVDPFVTIDQVESVRAAFAGRHDVQVIVHEAATHGFSHRHATRAYDPVAEQAGMESLRALIAEVGVTTSA